MELKLDATKKNALSILREVRSELEVAFIYFTKNGRATREVGEEIRIKLSQIEYLENMFKMSLKDD